MKEWTKEEIERLVPEEDLQRRAIALMPQVGRDTFSNWDLFEALLQTRLDLETAEQTVRGLITEIERVKKGWNRDHAEITRLREALERIASNGSMEENARMMQQIAREALKEKP